MGDQAAHLGMPGRVPVDAGIHEQLGARRDTRDVGPGNVVAEPFVGEQSPDVVVSRHQERGVPTGQVTSTTGSLRSPRRASGICITGFQGNGYLSFVVVIVSPSAGPGKQTCCAVYGGPRYLYNGDSHTLGVTNVAIRIYARA